MGWIILIVIGYFVISAIAESDGDFSGPYYSPRDSNTKSDCRKSHADWVKDSVEHDKKRGKEYDHMWAEEYLDEHD